MPFITRAEAVGLYLFAVGVYGGTYRWVTRHLSLSGVLSLDMLYLGVMLIGAGLMLFGRPIVPAEGAWQGLLRGLRLGISLAAVSVIAWWMLYR
ncbi:MAG: hypothetical protein VKS61_18285 [Candidatus Sericytochromatia bacterium]|nr:hypothetical protein [Candidatus Sericytochromatia bacterium]